MDLNKRAKQAYENAKKRQENGANINVETRNMLKHCATEVVEAMESFTFYDDPYCLKLHRKEQFAGELADIICCVLIIAHKEEIDIEHAILDCLERNRKRAEGVGDKK